MSLFRKTEQIFERKIISALQKTDLFFNFLIFLLSPAWSETSLKCRPLARTHTHTQHLGRVGKTELLIKHCHS